jgi:hypothetical protein
LSTDDTEIQVNYVDYRDVDGDITEVHDSAKVGTITSNLFGLTGSGKSPSSLYAIDQTTGDYSLIGPTGFVGCGALDFHQTSGVLYGVCGTSSFKELVTIDTTTGIATSIAPISGITQVSDIAFRSDGTLYAYHEPSDILGIIDPVTGVFTTLGNSGASCCGNGMAFDATGTLFHANNVALSTLDQTTGIATTVTLLNYPDISGAFNRINGMDFESRTGVLFGSLNAGPGPGGGGNGPNYLTTVDTTTGIVSIVGQTIDRLDAIAIKPIPFIPDHYLGYEAKMPKGTPAFADRLVHLADEFGTGTFNVEKPSLLINPVEKNFGGEISLIEDPQTHLEAYKIKERHDNILVENQFGELVVNTKQAEYLLVPTAKSHDDQDVSELDNSLVDHYKCYKVEIDKDAPIQFIPIQVTLFDPNFGAEKLFDVTKPKMLCNPVDKNGEGIKNHSNHLMCYAVVPADGFDHNKKKSVFTNNQFGPEKLDVTREKQMCVPSVMTLS